MPIILSPTFCLPSRQIVFTMCCILHVAGCVSPSSDRVNPIINMSETIPSNPFLTKSPNETLKPVRCPQQNNCFFDNVTLEKEPIINFCPQYDYHSGGTITLGGTTNLRVGENITLQIGSGYSSTCAKHRPEYCEDTVRPCCDLSQNVTVKLGGCGVNTWSLNINTSQHEFASGVYSILAISSSNPIVANETTFRLY